MKTVYFVRHGESEGNAARTYQSADTPLSTRGHEQAQTVAERCLNLSLDTVVASTMLRARDTAQTICNRTGNRLELSGLFIERYRPDELGGKSRDDDEVTPLGKAWSDSIFEAGPRVGNGENFDDLKTRAAHALRYLEEHPSKRILVVTHGFFLRLLAAYVMFGDELIPAELKRVISSFRADNTGISMFQYGQHREEDLQRSGDFWILKIWNDHAHLG